MNSFTTTLEQIVNGTLDYHLIIAYSEDQLDPKGKTTSKHAHTSVNFDPNYDTYYGHYKPKKYNGICDM